MDDRDRLVEDLFVQREAEAVRLAWALTGDASLAQELAQEAFVRVYVHRRRLREPAAAPAYLRRTVVNLAFSHSRKARRVGRPDDGGGEPTGPRRPDDDVAGRVDVRTALDALPARRRACVVLRFYLDLTETDTAAALGISVGTVKSQTHKALRQLREQLGEPELAIESEEQP